MNFAVITFTKVDDVAFVPSESETECLGMLLCASNAKIEVVASSIFSSLTITRTGSSSSSGVLSLPSMGSHHRASSAWCMTPAQCTTSKSNSNIRSCHRVIISVASAKFEIHQSEQWSVRMVSYVPSEYGRRRSTHQTMAINFC